MPPLPNFSSFFLYLSISQSFYDSSSIFIPFTSRSNARDFWFQSHEFKILNFDPFLITLYPSFTLSFPYINPLITRRSASSTFIPSRSNASLFVPTRILLIFSIALNLRSFYSSSNPPLIKLRIPLWVPPSNTNEIFFTSHWIIKIRYRSISRASTSQPFHPFFQIQFFKKRKEGGSVISMTWFLREGGGSFEKTGICSVERRGNFI